jgi:hypothetical protein
VKRPNFFIVGAPKCGTIALYTYLRRHPAVFMSHKEVHYFGHDLGHRYCGAMSEEDYLKLFTPAGAESALGDASVWYLFSKSAAQEIHDFDPTPGSSYAAQPGGHDVFAS